MRQTFSHLWLKPATNAQADKMFIACRTFKFIEKICSMPHVLLIVPKWKGSFLLNQPNNELPGRHCSRRPRRDGNCIINSNHINCIQLCKICSFGSLKSNNLATYSRSIIEFSLLSTWPRQLLLSLWSSREVMVGGIFSL